MAGGGGLREIELGRFELDPVLFQWQLDAPNDCSMPGSCRIAIRKLNGSLGSIPPVRGSCVLPFNQSKR